MDGANSKYKAGEFEYPLVCSIPSSNLPKVSCINIEIMYSVFIDPGTGKLGKSMMLGAVSEGDRRDSVSAEIYNRTEF